MKNSGTFTLPALHVIQEHYSNNVHVRRAFHWARCFFNAKRKLKEATPYKIISSACSIFILTIDWILAGGTLTNISLIVKMLTGQIQFHTTRSWYRTKIEKKECTRTDFYILWEVSSLLILVHVLDMKVKRLEIYQVIAFICLHFFLTLDWLVGSVREVVCCGLYSTCDVEVSWVWRTRSEMSHTLEQLSTYIDVLSLLFLCFTMTRKGKFGFDRLQS